MEKPLVSVVVPTYHRVPLLDICLAALVAQDIDPSLFEVIIVDAGHSRATRDLVERWSESTSAYRFYPAAPLLSPVQATGAGGIATRRALAPHAELTYLPLIRYLAVSGENHSPAHARNLGWRAAQGEYIAFTDDDCIPRSDWLRRGIETLEQGYDCVTGRVDMPISDNPTDYEATARDLIASENVTANCFYRKAALELTGGFDEAFQVSWRENTDLYFRLLDLKARHIDVNDAVVLHPIRPARWGVSLEQQRKNFYNALLYKKHPRRYTEKFGHRSPLRYYAAIAAALLGLGGLAAGQPRIAEAGFIVWLLLTLWFAGQRLQNTSHHPAHIAEMLVTSAMIPFLAIYWRLRGSLAYRVWHL